MDDDFLLMGSLLSKFPKICVVGSLPRHEANSVVDVALQSMSMMMKSYKPNQTTTQKESMKV
jgi:hypothetical protein